MKNFTKTSDREADLIEPANGAHPGYDCGGVCSLHRPEEDMSKPTYRLLRHAFVPYEGNPEVCGVILSNYAPYICDQRAGHPLHLSDDIVDDKFVPFDSPEPVPQIEGLSEVLDEYLARPESAPCDGSCQGFCDEHGEPVPPQDEVGAALPDRQLVQEILDACDAGESQDGTTIREVQEGNLWEREQQSEVAAAITRWNTRAPQNEVSEEVQRRMDAVVDAAVEWHQSGREGDNTWFDKGEVLAKAVDSLLELRGKNQQRLRKLCQERLSAEGAGKKSPPCF